MTTAGIGVDLVELDELSAMIARRGKRLLDRIFTAREQAYASEKRFPVQHLGARLAAKEAAFKALGTGWAQGVSWHDVEVVIERWGEPPRLVLTGAFLEKMQARGIDEALVSLTHTNHYASAVVLLARTGNR